MNRMTALLISNPLYFPINVTFSGSNRQYTYFASGQPLAPGELIIVPVHAETANEHFKIATVVGDADIADLDLTVKYSIVAGIVDHDLLLNYKATMKNLNDALLDYKQTQITALREAAKRYLLNE